MPPIARFSPRLVHLFAPSSHSSAMLPSFIPAAPLSNHPVLSSSSALRRGFSPRHVFIRRSSLRFVCTASNSSSLSNSSPATTTNEIPIGKQMTSAQIRQAFLTFFESKNHARLPSASLVPDDPTIMLNIAGMVPFKPIFLGSAPRPDNPRATTSQKCIRTNDIENVGVTKRHHTFFEMLGNFSFGDYFKTDAIQWAWQLLTDVYGIPPERLAISVFRDDDDAFAIWRDVVGVPVHRIQRLGEEDNFWVSGPTGPCGPCSEIYFDFNPTSTAPLDLEDDDRFIELYNLVFMQFSRDAAGNLTKLTSQNIDTGMGLERMAQVLQRVPTNYETDLILPIIDAVAKRCGISFSSASPKNQTSLKIIGDHLRAISHLIADGVRPTNVGRGYIVRRLIRRAVRHGKLLGLTEPFMRHVIPVVNNLAREANLHGIDEQMDTIITEIEREETRFLTTLETGEEILDEILESLQSEKVTVVPGADAFLLYDTFGFPLELTQEIAQEIGFSVDTEAFEVCMEEQKERARSARDTDVHADDISATLTEASKNAGPFSFMGYTATSVDYSEVKGIFVKGTKGESDAAYEGDVVRILLDSSPFYAEGGGQVGDSGLITGPDGVLRVDDTQKEGGAHVHIGTVIKGQLSAGDTVHSAVNSTARRRIASHHTATHLLQAALKEVIPDGGISQAGSLVDADRLRFDFNCPRALKAKELQRVEDVINGWISDGYDMVVSTMSLQQAKDAGAVAMFGEKYDEGEVRVVDVPGVSMELCGGTHVKNTADIGLFKVMSESGPSSGVRRIEAVCGAAVMPYLSVRDAAVKELSTNLKAPPEELPGRVKALQDELKMKNKELDKALAELAVGKALSLKESAETVGNCDFVLAKLDGNVSSDSLKTATENLSKAMGDGGIVILAAENDGRVAFTAAVGKTAQAEGITAGTLVGAVAKMCGGGGGGKRPAFAQAGGRDASKIEEALEWAKGEIQTTLSG